MNLGTRKVHAAIGAPVIERTRTRTTVASQQYYDLFVDTLFVKTVTVTVGSIAYPVQEVESQEMWDYLNARTSQTSDIPEYFFVRPNLGLGNSEIGLFPIPASASNTITIVQESNVRDLTASA